MKKFLKYILYASGITTAWHKTRNRNTLSVIMLHRILPAEKLAEQGADKEWTLTTATFEALLVFLGQHYNPISFDTLQSCQGDIQKLPKRAVLLTFDDGWQDNFEYAYPLLRKYAFPAHIFVATDVIEQKNAFWQEQIVAACARDPSAIEIIRSYLDVPVHNAVEAIKAIQQKAEPESHYADLFKTLVPYLPNNRQMLSVSEIQDMHEDLVTYGSHGASHTPLTQLSDEQLANELQRSAKRLTELCSSPCDNLSFPHGQFNELVLKQCEKLSYHYLFTSQDGIQKTSSKLLPRIHLAEHALCTNGHFDPQRAAFSLFSRAKI